MPAAARTGDPTSHPGVVGPPGVPNVFIEGRPAAVTGDLHNCAMPPNAGPHPPNPFPVGSVTVRIGGRGALRVGDTSACGGSITAGAATVMIGP